MKIPRSILRFVLPTLLVAAVPREGSAQDAGSPPSISLEDAFSELDRQSPSLAQIRARADEAAGLVRQARAALLPTLVAGGSYTRNSDQAKVDLSPLTPLVDRLAGGTGTVFLPSGLVIQPLEAWTANASARIPLIVPTAWYDVSAASHAERAAQAASTDARLRMRTGLAQSAHGTAALEQIVTASERAVEIATEHARSAERNVQAGTAAPLVSLRAKTEVVRRESDRARARADRDRAWLGLGVLIGRPSPVRIQVPELDEQSGAAPIAQAAIADAIQNRPDRVASHAQLEAASAQAKSAAARFFPQLVATGSVFASDVPYPTGRKEGWRVSLELTWQLYDGGYRYGKRQQTDAALRGAEHGAETERLGVIQQIQDAKRDLDVAAERLRLGTEQVRLATDAAASAKRTFEAGVASSLDVLDANDWMYQADIATAEARARFAQAVWSLERALGRQR